MSRRKYISQSSGKIPRAVYQPVLCICRKLWKVFDPVAAVGERVTLMLLKVQTVTVCPDWMRLMSSIERQENFIYRSYYETEILWNFIVY